MNFSELLKSCYKDTKTMSSHQKRQHEVGVVSYSEPCQTVFAQSFIVDDWQVSECGFESWK